MYKCIVIVACENSTEQIFEVAKVDSIAPVPTSEDSVSDEWAKEKLFTFTATDTGIGEVQIAFNDEADYEMAVANGTEFSRNYKLVGDVYRPKQVIALYKDGLGNISGKELTLNKLDNTAPTITKASIHNNVVTISSHDEHISLGEGSGVTKYKYVTVEEKLENPNVLEMDYFEVTKDEEIVIDDVYKIKYVYIVAEDVVGNVSEVYEFKIPELVLTSSVNLSNEKGSVILDWSTYDVSDKYFVIYRKEENASNWETIVDLEQKFTGSTFTDILAIDKNNSNVSSINIKGNSENNNIEITANSTDTGTKYTYYIEAYDSSGSKLLDASNIV